MLSNLIVKTDITIRHAMKALDETALKCLFVVNEKEKFLGTLTDGDLRRGILSGKSFDDTINDCYNNNSVYFFSEDFDTKKAKDILLSKKIDLIPILKQNKKIFDFINLEIIDKKSTQKNKLDNISVVIMAGGEGKRLEPFTSILPKPLIPVKNKTMIEHILDSFYKFGCNDFYISLNYKSKILKAYFEETQPPYKIKYLKEDKPLGTAGSLNLIAGNFKNPIFVTNCDIIIKSDYYDIFSFHKKGNYDLTLIGCNKEYIIPYGTCVLDDKAELSHINEKPKYDLLINTGLYVINPDVLNMIPKNKFFHITHLIENLKKDKKKVGVYPIQDFEWIDVGQWEEYKSAIKKL